MLKKLMKAATLIMAIAMIVSVFAGCGDNKDKDDKKATVTQDQKTVDEGNNNEPEDVKTEGDDSISTEVSYPLTEEKLTLSAWWPKVNTTQFYNSAAESPIFLAMEELTNVNFDFIHPISGQEQENFNIMVSSGDYPDLISGVETYYTGGGDAAVESGIIIELSELIDKYAPNYSIARTATDTIKKETVTDSGNMVAIHRVYKMPEEGAWYGPAVRKDFLDDAGLESPVTFDDWYEMLLAFKELGVKNPFTITKQGLPALNSFVGGFGISGSGTTNISFFQIDGVVKCNVLEEGYKEYLAMMSQWYSEGLVDQDFLTNSSFDDQIARASNDAGAFIVPQAFFPILKMNSTDENFEVIAVQNPVKKEGDIANLRQSNYTTSPNVAISISTACVYPEIAVKYLDYFFSEEGNMLANYGIEGKTYTMVDGEYQYTDFALNNPDGMTLVQLLECYGLGTGPYICDWSRTYLINTDAQNEAMEIWDRADNAYCMPPITMTSEEGSTYASIIGDADTYVQEMTVKYIMGVEEMSTYDDFIAQLGTMNLEEAITIQQAALDRYNNR